MAWPEAALAAYRESQPERKAALCRALPEPAEGLPAEAIQGHSAGRPSEPQLVHPARLPRRRLGSEAGRTALLHAIAHIEFNAINLALDACLRFPGMPLDYYRDWLSVARDEARHFEMLAQRLASLNSHYGALPAHNGLWEMAEKTADDLLLRMALVPRVLEARGLDVTPGMIRRLEQSGDSESARCLQVILEEEVRHVAIGSRWFRHCCEARGLDPDSSFLALLREHLPEHQAGRAMNLGDRRAAGFSETELRGLGASL